MARPVVIDLNNGGVIEAQDSDLSYIADLVLLNFSQNNTCATLTIGGSATGKVSIGSYVNAVRTEAVGTHPATGSTSSTTTTLYQVTDSDDESNIIRPVEIDSDSNVAVGLIESNDNSLDSTILQTCLNKIAAGTAYGVYSFSTSASVANHTQRGTLTDTQVDGTSVTYYLQQSTGPGISEIDGGQRPLKINNSSGPGLIEMGDSEIQSLSARLANIIQTKLIGTYAFQPTAPATGTWVQAGVDVKDTLKDQGNVAYAGNYILYYAGVNYGTFTGYYTGNTIFNTSSDNTVYKLWRRRL